MPEEIVKLNRIHFATELARSGLKLGDIAEQTGLRRETLSRAKNGKNVRVSTVKKLAAVFGVSAAQLVSDKEES